MACEQVATSIIALLRNAGPRGLTKAEIVEHIGDTTLVTVQRALHTLRDDSHGARIECSTVDRRWRLVAPLSLPLVVPEQDDLVALLVAKAIVEPLGDAELDARLGRLVEALDDRYRARPPGVAPEASPRPPHTDAVRATFTLGTPVAPQVLRALLAACRRHVLRIVYHSPWRTGRAARSRREIEPWAVQVHDGAVYLRAWDRKAKATRTFRVAHIDAVEQLEARRAGPVPTPAAVWRHDHPAYGVDEDRPGVAVIRFHGPVARWLERVTWHPEQRDVWLTPGERLERHVAYRSCREMARRVASVIDGVEAIEPEALRVEVAGMFARCSALGEASAERVEHAGPDAGEGAEGLPRVLYRARTVEQRAADAPRGDDGDGG